MLATASNAIVVGFSTGITDTARRAAEAEGVDVRLYDIIYKLTDDIDAALKGMLEPEIVEVVEGRAEVRQIFKVGKSTVIAGLATSPTAASSAVAPASGAAARSSRPTGSTRCAASGTTSARSQTNYECGIGLAGFHDLAGGRHHRVLHHADQPGGELALRPSHVVSQRIGSRRRAAPAGDRPIVRARSWPIRGSGSSRSRSVETTPDLRHAKVWVSVIGQPDERKATIERPRAVDAVRASRARQDGSGSGASRSCTSHLDDTAERGTRVLHLLEELECGRRSRGGSRRSARSLPTPVARLHTRATLAEEPPVATVRRRRSKLAGPAGGTARLGRHGEAVPRARSADGRHRGPASPARGLDPPLDLADVPDIVVGAGLARLRGACSPSATRTRMPTRSARCSASAWSSRRWAARADRVSTDPVPPLYDFMPASTGSARTRIPTRPTTCSSSPTAARSSAWAPSACATPDLFARLPRVDHRPPRVERRRGRGRLDRPGRGGDVRDGHPAGRPARAPARPGRWRPLAAAPDGRHRDGHRDLRAPERDAAHPRGRGGPGRGRGAALGHLAPAVPDQARRAAPAVRSRPGSPGESPDAAGHLVHAAAERTSRRPTRSRAHSEGIIDLLAQSEAAEVAMLFKEQDDGTTRLSRSHQARRRRCDRADRRVRWRGACAGRRRDGGLPARRGTPAGPRRGRDRIADAVSR